MNFVLHQHLARRDLGSAAAGLGAMLPDLWRMADRRMRARRGVGGTRDEAPGQLLAGIEHHLRTDAWFHEHRVFQEGLVSCQRAFSAIEAPRLRLFAHVAWELCLDGAWVRRRGDEEVLGSIRQSLASVDAEALGGAAQLHRPALREAPADVDRLRDRLDELMQAIGKGPWVTGYAHGDGLVARLAGVRRRFGFPAFESQAESELEDAFESLLSLAEQQLQALLDQPPASG